MAAAAYKDLRADAQRAQEQLTWIPAHRPTETVTAELNVLKAQRYWATTRECTEASGKGAREFCQQFYKLNAELASAQQSERLETRIAEIGGKIATGGTVMAEADPQASVLARLGGFEVQTVQTALTVFVALLIEIGSGFGMYVAFAYWRTHEPLRSRVPETASESTASPLWSSASQTATEADHVAQPPPPRRVNANDNRASNDSRVPNGVPDSDIQRHYRQRVVSAPGSSVTAQDLYDDYCNWCEEEGKEALPMPTYSREFKSLGVRKDKLGGRIRYFDVGLRAAEERKEAKKAQSALPRAA
jgi:hypothetical protein